MGLFFHLNLITYLSRLFITMEEATILYELREDVGDATQSTVVSVECYSPMGRDPDYRERNDVNVLHFALSLDMRPS